MKQIELAQALDLSKAQVSKLVAKGMPTSSVEAAQEWRRRNLDPGKVVGHSLIRKPAARRRQAVERDEPRNAVDIVVTSIIPRLFFMMDDEATDLEPITDTLRAAGLVLDCDEALKLVAHLADRYLRVVDTHMGCCDGPLNLPDALR